MGKHSKLFNSQNDYDSFILSDEFVLPNVSYIVENDTVNFHPYVMEDYESQYLTFEAIENSTFRLTQNSCQYSLDEGDTWVSLAAGTNTPTVPAGNKIMFKATNPTIASSYGIGTFSSTGKFNVEGNIMSLLYGDDFIGQNDLTGKDYVFAYLFKGCTNVVETHRLILPATTLSTGCYAGIFYGCTSLTTAPELPATTLVLGCYYEMFKKCRSLTTAPELQATTLAGICYYEMFKECNSLTTAPELPATTLSESCYYGMFEGCNSLTTAPELPATTLVKTCYSRMFTSCDNLNCIKMLATDISASECLQSWVRDVSSTGTFVKHPDMTDLSTGINGIPSGWTVENA